MEEPGDTFIRTIDDADRDRHVVAYWRFEDHPVGEAVADTSGNTKPVRGTVDSSFNGNDLFTYSASTRPRFSGDVPPDENGPAALLRSGAPNRGCLDNTVPPVEGSPTRDLYTRSRASHAAPIDIQKVKLCAMDHRGLGQGQGPQRRCADVRRSRRRARRRDVLPDQSARPL